MSFYSYIISVIFTLVVLVALLLSATTWRRRNAPGSLPFTLMMVAMLIWLLTGAIESTQLAQSSKVIWGKLSYLGIAWAPTLWFVFTAEYTRQAKALLQRWLGWMAVVPGITILLAMTNELHHLIWTQIYPSSWDVRVLVYEHGLWFSIFGVYSYFLLLAGLWLIYKAVRKSPEVYRSQSIPLLAGCIAPVSANILYIFNLLPIRGVDFTPYTFALASLFFAVSHYRSGMFEVIPVARDAILENIDEGFLVFDMQRRLVDVNRLAIDMLQLPGSVEKEIIIGLPASKMLSGWPVLLDIILSGSTSMVELETSRDGALLYLEAHQTPWFDSRRKFFSSTGHVDHLAGYVLILHDITNRKKIEAQLRESENLYRLLVNASPVGIALLDSRSRVTFASPREFEIHGVEPNFEIIGKPIDAWVHPDDRFRIEQNVQRMMRGEEIEYPTEYRLLRADGSFFWAEIHATVINNESGEKRGILAITRDITQRKELELQLQRNLEQQTFINDLLQILYRPQDMWEALALVLERTGQISRAMRVYLCEDNQDGKEAWVMLEWTKHPLTPADHPIREGPLLNYSRIPTLRKWMEERGMVRVEDLKNAPEDLSEFMDAWGVASTLLFPIYGDDRQYGFLGIDYDAPMEWSGEGIGLLWNVCRLVSSAIRQMQIEQAEHRERALADALRNMASALNSSLNLDEVLDRVLENLKLVVPHQSASIAMVDEDNFVRPVRWRGYSDRAVKLIRGQVIPLNEWFTYNTMAETGEPFIINDTHADRRWTEYLDLNEIRSYMGAPIQNKGRLVGFINLDSQMPDFFTASQVDRLRVFADSAAVAIENARLYNVARRSAEEMSILYRIGLTLTAGLEMNQVLVTLLEQCRQVLPIDVFYVALYDKETGIIQHPLFCENEIFRQVEPRSIFVQPGLSGEVIRNRQTLYLPDTLQPDLGPQYKILRLGGTPSRTFLGVPLIVLDQVVGIISIQSYQPHAYNPDQIRLLETIATQAAIAVQNAKLFDQMKQMAITDAVTHLFTRRHFTATGRSEVDRALRYKRALSVLMVDIDWFKHVNDTYGHNTGDQVLQAVAAAARQALRQTDIVGRWGGEEFAIVLPEADREGALMIAERIRRIVAETEIPTATGPLKITVSVGAAVLSSDCNTLEGLVDLADRAMYLAKQAGRNRVRIWEG